MRDEAARFIVMCKMLPIEISDIKFEKHVLYLYLDDCEFYKPIIKYFGSREDFVEVVSHLRAARTVCHRDRSFFSIISGPFFAMANECEELKYEFF